MRNTDYNNRSIMWNSIASFIFSGLIFTGTTNGLWASFWSITLVVCVIIGITNANKIKD